MIRSRFIPAAVVCALLGGTAAQAQFGTGDWTTTGYDAQRSYWVRADPKISQANMRKGGFELLWKHNMNEGSKLKGSVTPPVLLDFYISYRGFRTLGFTGNTANSVVAVDTDLGRLEWKTDFKVQPAPSSPACPGGMTSGVARTTNIAYPTISPARGFGRGTPAKSGVGEPFEGAVTLKALANRPAPPPRPAPAPARPAAPAFNPFAPRIQWVYALASDGKLHAMYVSNGNEPEDAKSFLPAGANGRGLIVVDNVAYVATTNKCGGAENGIWALDLASSNVAQWKSAGNVAGATGFAVGPDGVVYAAAGNELVALQDRTLRPKGSYKIGSQEFTTSPVVFEFKGKDLVAAMSNDGKLHLLQANALEQPAAVTPSFSAAGHVPGALASWQDSTGTRWILAPASGAGAAKAGFDSDVKNGGIVAWKVVDKNGSIALEPGWVSPDMTGPLTPVVVNDVVFAVASGVNGKRSIPAVVYALDPANGREFWNSGKALAGPVTTGNIAAGGTRIYVATNDGVQYAFGFGIEH